MPKFLWVPSHRANPPGVSAPAGKGRCGGQGQLDSCGSAEDQWAQGWTGVEGGGRRGLGLSRA